MKKILNYFVMGAVAVMFSAALASCRGFVGGKDRGRRHIACPSLGNAGRRR